MITARGIITLLVLAVLFALAVVWISRQGGWKGEGCGGNCSSCHQHCDTPEKIIIKLQRFTVMKLIRPLTVRSGGIFASQLTVVGGKDRDGAQQVVVGLLIGAVTDVQLVHHLFPPPPFHVAQL